MYKKLVIFLLLLVLFTFNSAFVYAQNIPCSGDTATAYKECTNIPTVVGFFGAALGRFYLVIRNVVIATGVVFVLFGGVMYITSTGDPEKAATARKAITWAIAAIIISLIVWVLLYLALKYMGLELSDYNIKQDGSIPLFFEPPLK